MDSNLSEIEIADKLNTFAEMLKKDGILRGLIGPKEQERIFERHIYNSSDISKYIKHNARVADIGSGGGLPGIPLAIKRPDLSITLIEIRKMRCAWLEEVKRELDLQNVQVICGKAESHKVDVDYVTARAVAPIERLIPLLVPFVAKNNGEILAIKGENAQNEIDNAKSVLDRNGVKFIEVIKDEYSTIVRAGL
jgi:16S rRNA (guanine527-N7)-methyltransferase